MIKAILFDFDGVLTFDRTAFIPVLTYISKKLDLPLERLKKEYYKHNVELLHGRIVHEDMWEEFCRDMGQPIDIGILKEAYRVTNMDPEMVERVKELKKSYRIGMVTDNKVDRIEEILDWFGLREVFDVVTISAQYHSDKKDTLGFELTLEKLGLEPQECVFVDNQPENLTAPEKMGIHTIFFDDEKRDYAKFDEELRACCI